MKNKIINHPLVKAWIKFVKEEEGCHQCQHPWYRGRCGCNGIARSYNYKPTRDGILHLAIALEREGWD